MTAPIYYSYCDSPLGRLCLQGDGRFVTGLYLPEHRRWSGPAENCREDAAPFAAAAEQLAQYFTGERTAFDVPLRLSGTPFQMSVWQELAKIPFGTTITYAQLAERVGQPAASRAVGNANGRNPISILVPCHRVVGAGGSLTGYAGGIARKRWLLNWEAGVALAKHPTGSSRPIAQTVTQKELAATTS